MKTGLIVFFLLILFAMPGLAQECTAESDSIEVIRDYKNLYRFQNLYLGGQPTYETLLWLKSQGVTKIVNLRSERENNEFTGMAFNESNVTMDLGIKYFSVPVDGIRDYTPEKLASMDSIVNTRDILFIHCASGGRVTDFFMGYLVKTRGYDVNSAIEIGRKLKFSLPLEKLLDTEIMFSVFHP
jgi:protein tyrosine phosphatase (PTP) superfamily phosphohydrolase (DUF442 family)